MSDGQTPFESGGVSIRPLTCRRCGTPLALIASGDEWSVEHHSDALSSIARKLSARLQVYRAGETVPAYLLVQETPSGPPERVLLVWPPEHRSILSAEDFRNVRPLLQRLHRCLNLPRIY